MVFQYFQLFAGNLSYNVAMGLDINKTKIYAALKKIGFQVDSDEMLVTPLTKEFDQDGLILSGGQLQKIAISRALYKDCIVQILYEPSSSLDPNVEEELNQTTMVENREKTVIFISRRLSTVRLADRIIFLNDGTIEETGNHNSLIERNGKYTEMFHVQASKYNCNKNE